MTSQHDWLLIPGRVLRLFSKETRPPKEKYIVLVSIKPVLMGFFINTEPTQFQKKRSHIMCELIELDKSDDYSFLTHKSYLDCTTVIDLEEDDIAAQIAADSSRDLKLITDDTRKKIIKIMESSLTLEGGIATIIKKNLEA